MDFTQLADRARFTASYKNMVTYFCILLVPCYANTSFNIIIEYFAIFCTRSFLFCYRCRLRNPKVQRKTDIGSDIVPSSKKEYRFLLSDILFDHPSYSKILYKYHIFFMTYFIIKDTLIMIYLFYNLHKFF